MLSRAFVATGLCLGATSPGWCERIHDPVNDAATLEYERFIGASAESDGGGKATGQASPEPDFNRVALSAYFPVGRILSREGFGGLRAEAMDRAYHTAEGRLNGTILQRYVLTLGSEVVKRPGQRSYAMVSTEYRSDFRRMDADGLGLEAIYAHFFGLGDSWEWGVGIDLIQYFGRWHPFPLLFLEGWLVEGTKARINGDVLEIRQFFGTKVCATVGARYNLFYGSLGRNSAFEMESVGLEAGLDYQFAPGFFLRVKGKGILWGTDVLAGKGGRSPDVGNLRGGTLRLALSYAI